MVMPSLRVIGLAYTGLGGLLALALVVAVALMPVGPVLQQVAEPARQAVATMVQPTSDAVTLFFGGGPVMHLEPIVGSLSPDRGPASPSFSDAISLDVIIADDSATPVPVAESAPVVSVMASRAYTAEPESAAPEAADELVEIEPVEISAPYVVQTIVQPAPAAVLYIASQDLPKALPTLPLPTETALQVKARMDAQNQAAIDAAKATQARAKADADAANDAAIAARKAALTTPIATIEPTRSPFSAPSRTASATPMATPHSKAALDAANQAAIDAARLAQARAKADANAANETALQAARSSTGQLKATSTPNPSAQPPPPATRPISQPMPPIPAAQSAALAVSADVVEQLVDEASLENAPIDQAATLADDSPV